MDPGSRRGSLSGRQKVLIALGALLCAAVFFGALVGAWLSSRDDEPARDRAPRGATVDPDCRPEVIGEEDGPIVAVYGVRDGQLGSLCHGVESEAVVEAWDALVQLVPIEQRRLIASFAGFDAPEDPPAVVAFAGPIDSTAQQFTVAVEVDESEADPEELQLTVMHEFAHVISQTPDQLDLSAPPADCGTFHNGYGCFAVDSYVWAFAQRFWSEADLAAVPGPDGFPQDFADGRCLADPSFPGAYAASHPEEDFAESFAAFVFSIDLPPAVQPRLAFFAQYDELAIFRDNARAAGLSGLGNNFDVCG